ncbi:ParB/RepB/Spo0J family partition protein [uncultured Desulfosarcina sp.]|uniref:ParB/RepB/Spo0J family partition protein n=1 Tax=uncultured Desulfosarcina sp. TaxID=218289 RepID=UPI0029C7E9B6|nr:ParB/RepB/Spo0J family partition protein [uncultured Desulfosarcina sp.]
MQRTFEEISVTAIAPSPFNPRKSFSGAKFDELVASIANVGVLEPVLVRPVDGKTPFELVAGERRWRARMTVAEANGGVESATIPAMVQPMDDDTALDIQTIENLQREDLDGLEEAQAFKIFVDRKGVDAIPELAQRTGIKEQYIRRRLMILRLPKKILTAWGKGELKYGHLEQLARMDDKQQRMQVFDKMIQESRHRPVSVSALKDMIQRISPALKSARFDIEAEGCLTCTQNTGVQIKLFDMGSGDDHCNRPACFKQKQSAHLLKTWSRTKYPKKFGTTGFRFDDEVGWNDCHHFWGSDRIAEKCRSCENHLSILYLSGESSEDRACFGDEACFKAAKASKSSDTGAAASGNSRPEKQDGPRVAWHGKYFREAFFQEQLPQRFETVVPGSITANQVALFTIVKGNGRIHDWYMERHPRTGKKLYAHSDFTRLDSEALFSLIAGMDMLHIKDEINAVALQAILSDDYATEERGMVARHIGIDLAGEWRFTAEYLDKKTKAEMMAFGESFGLFEDPQAQAFLADTLKRKAFKACKKGELIRVFLESGADTSGMVPGEILGDPPADCANDS